MDLALTNRIQEYKFGRIVVDGQVYQSDVIIDQYRVQASWWRKDGHRLIPNDLPFLKKGSPKILVVGQGYSGFMNTSPELIIYLKDLGIDLKADKTGKAVENFNGLWNKGERDIIAALHLTC